MTEDWAEAKAEAWLFGQPHCAGGLHPIPCGCADLSSLAALLREERAAALAEARRVVLEVYERDDDMPPHKRDELLARLEAIR